MHKIQIKLAAKPARRVCGIERILGYPCGQSNRPSGLRAGGIGGFMFLIRMTFWVGLAVLLLPTDQHQQAKVYDTAAATVERISTFCDRNPKICATGADLWAGFVKKAEFGGRMAFDLINSRNHGAQEPIVLPAGGKDRMDRRLAPAAARGTLKPDDLSPAWRGQQALRTGA
jgi:hypothetical protein